MWLVRKYISRFFSIFLLIFLLINVIPLFSLLNRENLNSTHLRKAALAKYTYISYVCADNNLETYGRGDVNEMETGFDDSVTNVHVISLLDLLSGDTTAYYISHDTDPNTITSTQLVIPGMASEANFGDPNTLITFVNFCMTYYPAEHYVLDLWDHGSGWAICFDETSGDDALTMAELRDALATINTTTGDSIDILVMDACLMGTLEVAYEVRDHASILVASEDAILASGFPYDNVIADLCNDPNQTITEFATEIVDLFYASSLPIFPAALSAVNLTLVNSDVFPNFANFAQNLHSYLNYGIKNELYNARTATESFYDLDYIDLYDFAQNVKNEATNATIRQLSQNLLSNISAAVIHEQQVLNPGAYGLSIYFPSLLSAYSTSYATYFSLSNDTLYDEFLQKYYTTANFGLNFRYYQINDSLGNNNNTPDPGETILIDIELENIGDIEAGFLNGSLICLDVVNVTILDGIKSYGNLTPSEIGSQTFSFNISNSCALFQVLPFIIITESQFDTYLITRNFTFELVVGRKITPGGSTLQTATEISIGPIYGNLPGPGTAGESWLKINCPTDLYLFLNLTGPALTDFDAYVYGPDEKLVSVAGKATYPDECSLLLMQSGYYYIKLIACGAGSGYYELFVNFTTEAYEDGLGYGTAFTLAGNASVSGTLPGPGAAEFLYYRVIMLEGQRIQVTLEGELGTDFDLYIYDSNLNEIDRSTSPSSSEYCVERADSTGYYYIVLVRYSGSGTYTLEVEVDDYDFPLWLLILIIVIAALFVVVGIMLYHSSVRKSQDLASTQNAIADVESRAQNS